MYAVIATGGKQQRVEIGSVIEVETLAAGAGEEVGFTPVLFVDGDTVTSVADALSLVTVAGKVIGSSKGPKITGFTYKAKARARRRYGHRQHYTTVEITSIEAATKRPAHRARTTRAKED